jgi:hypothetical protein
MRCYPAANVPHAAGRAREPSFCELAETADIEDGQEKRNQADDAEE